MNKLRPGARARPKSSAQHGAWHLLLSTVHITVPPCLPPLPNSGDRLYAEMAGSIFTFVSYMSFLEYRGQVQGSGAGRACGPLTSHYCLHPHFLPDSPKQVMTVIQTPTRIREGDNVTVSCQYNSSNPKVTYYQWNSIRSQGSSRELKIYNVAWDHKAVACAACNGWCSWSPEVNLHVQCE